MASSFSLAMFSLGLLITYLMPITVVGDSKCDIQASDIQSELCSIKEKVAALQTAFSAVVKLQTDVANLWHAVQSQTAKIVEHDNAIKQAGSPNTIQQISDMQKTVSELQNKTSLIEAKCSVCHKKTGPCDSNPCHNNGSCVSISDGYYCVCTANYTGPHCDQIDPCIDKQPCQNGGKCTNSIIGYICQCNHGYEGPNCDIKTNPCDSQPCHHGLCAPGNDTFSCLCDSGYYGDTCNDTLGSTVISPGSSLSPVKTTKAMGICEKTSPCNDPAKCVDHGQDNYTCECPETPKTKNDRCIRPYYLLPYGFCCTKDICKNADPDCYTPPDGLTLPSSVSTTPLLSSTPLYSSSATIGPSVSSSPTISSISSQTSIPTNLTVTQAAGPTDNSTMSSSVSVSTSSHNPTTSQSPAPSSISANTNLLPSSTQVSATSSNSAGTQTTVSGNTNAMSSSVPASVPNPSSSQSSVQSTNNVNSNMVPSSTQVSATSINSAGTQTTVSGNTNTMSSSASVSASVPNPSSSQSSVQSTLAANTNMVPSSTPISATSSNSATTQTNASTNILQSSASISTSFPNPTSSQSSAQSIIFTNTNPIPSSTPITTISGTHPTSPQTRPSDTTHITQPLPISNITSQNSVVAHTTAPFTMVTSSTKLGPCDQGSPCNDPSKCVDNGNGNYTCICPETLLTINDKCLEPYYLLPYGFCCVKDICNNTDPDCFSTSPVVSSNNSQPNNVVSVQTVTFTSKTPQNIPTSTLTTPLSNSGTSSLVNASPMVSATSTIGTQNPCDSSPCNDPAKCVEDGKGNYTCQCPETLATQGDSCLEPYYLLPYGFCCSLNTCNNTGPDCFSSSPIVTSNNNASVTSNNNASLLNAVSSTTTVSPSSPCYNNPCNEPAMCTDTGNGKYKCECPPTPKTLNDPCIEPYYLLPYGFCCTKDTCKGTDPDCI